MSKALNKTLVIFVNLGSPRSLRIKHIRSYLREFLMDPDVISIPFLLRWFLVNGIIVPFRCRKTLAMYTKIWNSGGSPLIMNTEELVVQLQKKFTNIDINYAMRYSSPNIKKVLQEKKSIYDKIIIFPLYPQWAMATVGTLHKYIEKNFSKEYYNKISFIPPFYDQSFYIKSLATIYKDSIKPYSHLVQHTIFSYHGLPLKQMMQHSKKHPCNTKGCCDKITQTNKECYKAHCIQTSFLLASELSLPKKNYSIAFQSRLGKQEWIEPYLEEMVLHKVKEGVKHLAIMAPSFTSDCLETLEEINISLKEKFLENGGETFIYIPCLNVHPEWIRALKKLIDNI